MFFIFFVPFVCARSISVCQASHFLKTNSPRFIRVLEFPLHSVDIAVVTLSSLSVSSFQKVLFSVIILWCQNQVFTSICVSCFHNAFMSKPCIYLNMTLVISTNITCCNYNNPSACAEESKKWLPAPDFPMPPLDVSFLLSESDVSFSLSTLALTQSEASDF